MSDVSGIPNMGFGGGGYFGGSAALGLPAMSSNQINASMGWNPMASFNPWANTPGGFGGQTSYYSNLGAAFGRNTGGFGGYGAANADPFTPVRSGYPSGQVTRGQDLAAPPWQDPFGGGGGGDSQGTPIYDPWTGAVSGYSGGGIGGENARDQLAQAMRQPAANPYAQMYRMPTANPSYFNPGTYAGNQGNYGIPYNGRSQAGDIGFSRQPSYPNLGYNPGMANWFAPQSRANAYAPLGGAMQFPGSGTPSQQMPMYGSGDTLTPTDRYGDPFQIIPGG